MKLEPQQEAVEMDTRIVSDSIGRIVPGNGARPSSREATSAPTPANQSGQSASDALLSPKPQISERPMGVDPSMPPQSLFDAALISSAFKAQFVSPIEEQAEAAADPAQSASDSPSDPVTN